MKYHKRGPFRINPVAEAVRAALYLGGLYC